MLNRIARLGVGLAVVFGSACGAGGEEALDVQDVGTAQAELAPLEYNQATGACGEYSYIITGGSPLGQWGRVGYSRATDDFCVIDDKADGMRVGVHWRLGDDSRRGLCYFTGGEGNSGRCGKEFADGKRLELRIGRCNGSVDPCDTPSAGWEWGPWESTGTGT